MPHRLLSLGLLLMLPLTACADERLAGIACRSVHLAYDAPPGVAFYNEVTVQQSAAGTYYCACGWRGGYFGIQELAGGKKVVIFSVWDRGQQDDPDAVPELQRVRLVHQGQGVRVGRFGNEGTGGQSFLDFDWQIGQTYRFLVTAKVADGRTLYAGYFAPPATGDDGLVWQHLVTFSTPDGGPTLRGYYSFVEDFRRNRISATQTRAAVFGPGWVRSEAGEWSPLKTARFTADSNPALNIDAAAANGRFVLKTGGEITNAGTPLGQRMALDPQPLAPPIDLPQ